MPENARGAVNYSRGECAPQHLPEKSIVLISARKDTPQRECRSTRLYENISSQETAINAAIVANVQSASIMSCLWRMAEVTQSQTLLHVVLLATSL